MGSEIRISPIFNVRRVEKASSTTDYARYLKYEAIRQKYGKGVTVAVVDNGVSVDHMDLAYDVISLNDYTGEGALVAGEHATHVAGIISSDKHGLSNETPIASEKVLSVNGSGTYNWLINAIRGCKDKGITILNLSLGSDYPSDELEEVLAEFVSDPRNFVIVAAGNDGTKTDYPAAWSEKYRGIISVAAGDINNGSPRLAPFSSPGAVTVTYQGVEVLSTFPKDMYAYLDGTSMASPGVAALVSLAQKIYPNFNHEDFHNIAQMSTIDIGTKGLDVKSGYGFLIPEKFLANVELLANGEIDTPIVDTPIEECNKSFWSSLFASIFSIFK